MKLKLCWIVKKVRVDKDFTTIFHFCTFSREIIDVFSDLTKSSALAFGGHCLNKRGLSNFA